jgi:hypothetical protein
LCLWAASRVVYTRPVCDESINGGLLIDRRLASVIAGIAISNARSTAGGITCVSNIRWQEAEFGSSATSETSSTIEGRVTTSAIGTGIRILAVFRSSSAKGSTR